MYSKQTAAEPWGIAPTSRTETMVLRAIWLGDAETRSQLAVSTGLSRPTIIAALSALREKNLIHLSRRKRGALGRDPEYITLNRRAIYGIGVDIGGTKTAAALVDLSGEIVAEITRPTVCEDAEALVESVAELKRQLLDNIGTGSQAVQFVAVGIPGVMQDDGRLLHTGTLLGLDSRDIRELFQERLGCHVHFENDVNMAAYGELLNTQSFSEGTRVLISVGTGLGMGIVHCGEVLRGSTGHAGEIAYLPISDDLQSPLAIQHGAAEMLVSGPVFEERYFALSGKQRTADKVLEMFLDDDPHAITAVNELSYHLARIIVSVVVTLDPELVVLAGGLGSSPILQDPLRRAVNSMSPLPVKLEPARFGGRAGVVGAATFAQRHLQKFLTAEK